MHDLADRDPRLPGMSALLDAASLSEVVGEPADLQYLRYKPGTSVLVAYTTARGAHWAGVWAGPDKPASARRRDSSVRQLPGIPWSAGGPARSDRVLARAVRSAEHREPSWRGAQVVRHNPGRRLVVRTADAYAKTAPGRAHAAARNAHVLRRAGIPTLEPRVVTAHTWATASWGDTDLATIVSTAHAAAAGVALARLHALTGDVDLAQGSEPGPRADRALRALRTALPAVAGRAADLARHLPLSSRRATVHGDFTADQILSGPDGRIRVIDLDRMAAGDPALDLAAFAVEEYLRTGELTLMTPLFAAYRAAGGIVTEKEWRAATVLCALERAIEPFRRCHPQWPSLVTSSVERAGDLR
ncbi:phosphotransferase family protein [Microbacterium sp. NPDC090007]|uniref:phosphotransferase family protein n=1 Tax=Microbacterium sp. NPDC090007 TaxID=3364204 RepID=UPI00381D0D5F